MNYDSWSFSVPLNPNLSWSPMMPTSPEVKPTPNTTPPSKLLYVLPGLMSATVTAFDHLLVYPLHLQTVLGLGAHSLTRMALGGQVPSALCPTRARVLTSPLQPSPPSPVSMPPHKSSLPVRSEWHLPFAPFWNVLAKILTEKGF